MSSCLCFASDLHRKHYAHNTGMRRALLFTDSLGVHVHDCSNIGVAQEFLLNFHVDSEFAQYARLGVAKRVPANAFSQFCRLRRGLDLGFQHLARAVVVGVSRTRVP